MKRLFLLLAWLPLWAASNRYIVELQTEPVAGYVARSAPRGGGRAALASAGTRSYRARVRAEQARVRRDVETAGATVLEQVDTVDNALLVTAPDEQAAARLAGIAGVRRVIPVRHFRLMLDHALPLHKVPEAWAQVGADKAGAGVRIAMIDTGIDVSHPGFQDASMAAPPGFPLYNRESDAALTNGKVIVARSYAGMFPTPDPDPSARDDAGHGTATAMAAAGAPNTGPLATITGVAPKAWLGNYKIFGTVGVNDSPTDDIILKAIDDAVADGMDVINMSLGSALAPVLEIDPIVNALERAASVGVIAVVSAGNTGPDANTIASPATAPSAIAVGASANDRMFSANVSIADGGSYVAIPGNGKSPAGPITAPLVDVASLDGNGLACAALPAASLTGAVALILRGTCTFEVKLNNAQAAGAQAALVYTDDQRPDPIGMDVGAATLPAEMVSWQDGTAIKQLLPATVEATLQFTLGPVYWDPNRLAGFSARGPNVNGSIKPDLVAVGTNVYTAAEKSDPRGDVYSSTGYIDVDGTSFSAPLVAGAAALVKAARPGLTVDQYRSLLVNSAAQAYLAPGTAARVQQGGAGLLDAGTAVRSTLAAAPVSLSFGAGGPDQEISRQLTLTNLGTAVETYLITALPRDGAPAPALPSSTVQLDPGASTSLTLTFSSTGLAPGEYDGVLAVQGTLSGVESHIPYWYAVGPGTPRTITILYTDDSPMAGAAVSILFRVTDAAGLSIVDQSPAVTVVSGGGAVTRVRSRDTTYPGVFSASVTLGRVRGANIFRIQAGDLTKDVSIVGQ